MVTNFNPCNSVTLTAGLKPHIAEDVDLTQVTAAPANEPTSQQKKRTSRLAKVSFEDYHSLWSGIATTKPVPSYDNPLGEVFKLDSKLQTAHFGLPHKELQDEIHKQLTEHNALMYGSFERSKGSENLNELKASKIQLLRQIYLPKQQGKRKSWQLIAHCRLPGWGHSHMKRSGMLVGSFCVDPWEVLKRAWFKLFSTPKKVPKRTFSNYKDFSL